jgi:hypothetical protein
MTELSLRMPSCSRDGSGIGSSGRLPVIRSNQLGSDLNHRDGLRERLVRRPFFHTPPWITVQTLWRGWGELPIPVN